jgi:coiled-coil domain-containing protein 12
MKGSENYRLVSKYILFQKVRYSYRTIIKEIRLKAANKDTAVSIPSISHVSYDTASVVDPSCRIDNELKIRFRNYQPYDATLKKKYAANEDDLATAKHTISSQNNITNPSAEESSNSNSTTTAQEHKEVDILTLELSKYKSDNVELNIIPKKINWDLKAQVEGKLAKLRTRTQRAIVELLREKISKEDLEGIRDE